MGAMGLVAAPLAEVAHADSQQDQKMEKRIQAKLKGDTQLTDVQVQVDNGIAVLTGWVPAEAARERAEGLARGEGAAAVDNRIMVDVARTGDIS